MGVMLIIKMQSEFTESSQAIAGFQFLTVLGEHAENRNSSRNSKHSTNTACYQVLGADE